MEQTHAGISTFWLEHIRGMFYKIKKKKLKKKIFFDIKKYLNKETKNKYTKNLNKPVFCVPSSLENSKGLGTNELIKNGSKLVTKVEDILIEYPQIKFKKKLLKEREKQVPKELEKVYKCIKNKDQRASKPCANRSNPLRSMLVSTIKSCC